MALYPNFKPAGVRKDWESCSIEPFSAAVRMRQFGVPGEWGDPSDAVAWFDHNGDGVMRVLVADYPNGRRVTVRVTKRDRSVTFGRVREPSNA